MMNVYLKYLFNSFVDLIQCLPIQYQFYYMSDLATSQVEKHFLTNNVYKRSRRYFDIAKLNQLEHELQVSRRKPHPCKDTIDTRLSSSFICSEELLHDKVNNDLDYFHSRKQWQEDKQETETNYTIKTARAKTVDMRKMLARSQYDRTKPITNNEEQFNNYKMALRKPRASLDFDNFIGRTEEKSAKRVVEMESEDRYNPERLGKLHEKVLFDQSHYSCFVNYAKTGRSVSSSGVIQLPIYDLAKLQRGQNLTKKRVVHLHQFYHGNGKDEPSQMDNRIIKQNEYFWRHVREQRERFKDFQITKRRQDEQQKRLQSILQRKKLPDVREEMCDEKYFRRGH